MRHRPNRLRGPFCLLPAAGIFVAAPPGPAGDRLFETDPEKAARQRLVQAQARLDEAQRRVRQAREEERAPLLAQLAEAQDALREAGRALREVRLARGDRARGPA